MKRHFRSKLLVVRRYLAIVWTQINYYIYDPSKPSKAEFLKLSDEDQLVWIEANVPKYVEKLYGDNYLGCSYEIDEDTVDEYLEYREDYNVLGLIGKQLPNISDERIDEIDEGAELTDEELEALRRMMNLDGIFIVAFTSRCGLVLCMACLLVTRGGKAVVTSSLNVCLRTSSWRYSRCRRSRW
jgi:hypothetical protein